MPVMWCLSYMGPMLSLTLPFTAQSYFELEDHTQRVGAQSYYEVEDHTWGAGAHSRGFDTFAMLSSWHSSAECDHRGLLVQITTNRWSHHSQISDSVEGMPWKTSMSDAWLPGQHACWWRLCSMLSGRMNMKMGADELHTCKRVDIRRRQVSDPRHRTPDHRPGSWVLGKKDQTGR